MSSNKNVTEIHRDVKPSLWQRWMAWSGSFLVISILLHVILLGGATILVVQVVQNQKEKMKFTAPPPSPAGMSEHKVKPSKKTAAAAPAISKRITTSAANASIALPAMDMSSSTGPDMMASVMSGLGSAGLGSGAGGAAGMASMPLSGLTAFGFKGSTVHAGLVGHIYDLKQTSSGGETDIKADGILKNPHLLDDVTGTAKVLETLAIYNDRSPRGKRADLLTQSLQNHAAVVNEFVAKNWDESVLKRYYESKDRVTAFQVFITKSPSLGGLKAFGVEKEVKPFHYLVYYTGFVMAPKDGEFRFRGDSGGAMLINFDGNNVFGSAATPLYNMGPFAFKNTDNPTDTRYTTRGYRAGKWFRVEAGKKYPVKILLEDTGDYFYSCLMIEDRNPDKPYEKMTRNERWPEDPPTYRYPVFALMKGLPLPEYPKAYIMTNMPSQNLQKSPGFDLSKWRSDEPFAEAASNPIIFPGAK